MSNFGSGMVVGYVAGSAAQQSEDEAKQRRLSAKGKDQQLYIIDKRIDEVGEKLSDAKKEWYYKKENKEIWIKKPTFFVTSFIISLILFAIVSAIICFCAWEDSYSYARSSHNTILLLSTIFGSILLSLFFGRALGGDDPVSSIELKEKKDKTLVCIQVYNSDGYRKYDEIELYEIADALGLEPTIKE